MKRTKKVAAAPYVAKQPPKKEVNPLIEKRPKNFGIGKEQQGVDDGVATISLCVCVCVCAKSCTCLMLRRSTTSQHAITGGEDGCGRLYIEIVH